MVSRPVHSVPWSYQWVLMPPPPPRPHIAHKVSMQPRTDVFDVLYCQCFVVVDCWPTDYNACCYEHQDRSNSDAIG